MKLLKKIKQSNGRVKIYLFGIKIFSHRKKIKKTKKTKLLKNLFNKNYQKNALVSYIQQPFQEGLKKSHTNLLECYTAAQIFDELEYNVDVIEWEDILSFSELLNYEVVYGFGKSFHQTLPYPNIKNILYAPGCYVDYSNKKTIQKVRDFYKKTGVFALSSSRLNDVSFPSLECFSDRIIVLGNEFVANTYKPQGIEQNIKSINAFYYDVYDINLDNKDFESAKKTFLWFGSSGCLHKGLDICIEIFKKRLDINLIICGAHSREKEFFAYYKDVFEGKYPHIQVHPFIDLESEKFKEIMNISAAIITPSVSEGGAPATLNVMANGGLIPLISTASGLNVGHYGFMFDEISLNDVEKQINKLLSMEEKEIKNLSKKVKSETRQIYAYENYKKNLTELIKTAL